MVLRPSEPISLIEFIGNLNSCKFNTKVLNFIDFGNLDDSNESERFRGCYYRFHDLQKALVHQSSYSSYRKAKASNIKTTSLYRICFCSIALHYTLGLFS